MTDPATKAVSPDSKRHDALRGAIARDDYNQGRVTFAAFAVDVSMLLHDFDTAQAEIDHLRAQLQEQALQYLSDNGQWIEETGRLRGLVAEMLELSDNWPGVAYSYDLETRARAALTAGKATL